MGMEQFFKKRHTLARLREGPLGPFAYAYADQLAERGYARDTARCMFGVLGDFCRWFAQCGAAVHEIDEETLARYLRYRHSRRRPTGNDAGYLAGFLRFLVGKGAAPERVAAITPVKHLKLEFRRYLQHERALAQATIQHYSDTAERFLAALYGDGQVELGRLHAADVIAFVQREAKRVHANRARLVAIGLRSFLQYLHHRGLTAADLRASVPTVANWKMASIPKTLSPDEVKRLLDQCDRSTDQGRRDYAILLLLARLGLRRGEIAELTLDDLNWESGEIRIRGPAGRCDRLPMPCEVGEALVAYLQHGRPACVSRHVFIRAKAPLRELGSADGLRSMVCRALARAGLNPPMKGTHLLRHSLATQMLKDGASLAEIGEILRHRQQQTTTIYAKVDLASLRTLALPWPGGVR
ncbi:MAG TPA: site-specific integrase [Burkholderiaceae bacterium]|nr:site-specific integrase [Burkholderiaceae bacterium]